MTEEYGIFDLEKIVKFIIDRVAMTGEIGMSLSTSPEGFLTVSVYPQKEDDDDTISDQS